MTGMTEKQEIRHLMRERKSNINNADRRAKELGIGMNQVGAMAVRLDALVNHLYGEWEIDDDGELVSGSIERVRYEAFVSNTLLEMIEGMGAAAALDPSTPVAARTASGLHIARS